MLSLDGGIEDVKRGLVSAQSLITGGLAEAENEAFEAFAVLNVDVLLVLKPSKKVVDSKYRKNN